MIDKPVGKHTISREDLSTVLDTVKTYFTEVEWDGVREHLLFRKIHTRLLRLRHDWITKAQYIRGPKRKDIVKDRVESLEQQVTDLTTALVSLRSDLRHVDSLEQQVTDLATALASLCLDTRQVQGDVQQVQSEVRRIRSGVQRGKLSISSLVHRVIPTAVA